MEENTTLLELRNVSKSFSGIQVLKDIDLEIIPGEVHVLLGENGAGKSTLIKILTGAYTKDSGEIYWEATKIEINNPLDAMNLGIATIYQELNLIPQLSVYENIFLGREIKNGGKFSFLNRKAMKAKANEYLKRLGQDISPDAKISSLGVGKQQLVEIAKALTIDTKLIIMDEPTSSLSEAETEQLLNTIFELRRQGISVIYISHKLDEVKRVGDRVTILRDGSKIDTLNVKNTDTDTMIQLMVGRNLTEKYPKKEFKTGDEGLRVEKLRLKGSKNEASFSAYQGQILGVFGLVGAGRTELARGIFGIDPTETGRIFVFGQEVSIKSPEDAIKAGLAFITEDRKSEGLFLDQTLEFNITIANLKNFKKNTFLHSEKLKTISRKYINELQVRPNDINKDARKLSGGNQQKVVIAKWLCTDARVFIFDEPTRGIDVGAKVEVYRLINSLVESGAVVVIISSELPEILGICDRVLVMNDGKITADLPRELATQEKIMKAATGGGLN